MPPPMTRDNILTILHQEKLKQLLHLLLSKACAKLLLNYAGMLILTGDVVVSVAGTWHKKGLMSTNRVITAISVDSGKVLDTCILSKSCKCCTKMELQKQNYYEIIN